MKYYLRKEPYEATISEIVKTDGEVIPGWKYMIEDRAFYKHNKLARYYRDNFPQPCNKELHLYTTKSLKIIMRQRQSLFYYCGEWFDVYDENGKVDISDIKIN